jgi:hypothetical protein
MSTSSAAYSLSNDYDQQILSHISSGVSTASPDMVLNADSATGGTLDEAAKSVDMGFGTSETSPLNLMSRLSRLLDEQDVPEEGRWFVAEPKFWEVMQDENSKLLDVDFSHDRDSILRNGRVAQGKIRGFDCYKSNNVPSVTNATGMVLGGHISAVSTATSIAETEILRSEDFFGDKIRGLHVYGRKVLRAGALVKAFYLID